MKSIIQSYNKKLLILPFIFFCHFLFSNNSEEENRIKSYFYSPDITTLNISDWKNPTYDDYWLIQNHIDNKLKAILDTPPSSKYFNQDYEGWITYRLGKRNLISKNKMPEYSIIYFNNDPTKKDKCVICYASHPYSKSLARNFARGINLIAKSLKAYNFNGHFIYRIGGWPNLKKGRLKYADVPYAFKPFFFEEARDLGYKKILWLDAASIPINSLNPIFNFMEKNGCCFVSQGKIQKKQVVDKEYVRRSLNIEEKPRYNAILTQVVGLNLNNKKASQLLDRWIKAAEKKVPFLESSGDQQSFVLLVHDLGLLRGQLPCEYFVEGDPGDFSISPTWHPNAIIFHQYDFLTSKTKIPKNIFERYK